MVDKHHLSANKGRLLRNKEQAKVSHGIPLYVISMSLVCRFYVVFMSFLCHLRILQTSEIELNTTNLCHMSLVFVISHIYIVISHEKSGG